MAELSTSDQALIARADAAHSPTSPQDPVSKFAGKFTTVSDLETSYKNAESELGKRAARIADLEKQVAGAAAVTTPAVVEAVAAATIPVTTQITPAATAVEPVVDPAVAAADAAGAELKAKGLDMLKYERSFLANGALAEADYAELATAGFDKVRVDTYVAGLTAIANQSAATAYAAAGGKEAYSAMAAWASVNVSEADLTAYNASLTAGGAQSTLAIEALKGRYDKAVGTESNLVGGAPLVGAGGDAFASMKELSIAQSDPRYKSDPAYRRQVEQKAGRSAI